MKNTTQFTTAFLCTILYDGCTTFATVAKVSGRRVRVFRRHLMTSSFLPQQGHNRVRSRSLAFPPGPVRQCSRQHAPSAPTRLSTRSRTATLQRPCSEMAGPQGNARAQLQILANNQAGPDVVAEICALLPPEGELPLGPDHAPTFRRGLQVRLLGRSDRKALGVLFATPPGRFFNGSTKKKAEEAAAQWLLSSGGVRSAHEALATLETDAWLGDRALYMLVALLGEKAGLTGADLDGVAQRCTSNAELERLLAARGQSRPSTHSAGTAVEAGIGKQLRNSGATEQLLAALLPALRQAAPDVVALVEQAVQAANAG